MKMDTKYVSFNLHEALEELNKLCSSYKANEITEPEFSIRLAHCYHHLNHAWNGRYGGFAEMDKHFKLWSTYPLDDDAFRSLYNKSYKMNLVGISEIQKPIESLATIRTKRLGVILRMGDLFVLEVNTTPGYNRITSFLNTTLSQDVNEDFDLGQLQHKAINLIQARTGYTNLQYSFTLDGSIERHFHKPDKEYNEIGLYDKTILVYDILSKENKIDIEPETHREVMCLTEHELIGTLQPNGQNGSSYLMKQLYDLQIQQ